MNEQDGLSPELDRAMNPLKLTEIQSMFVTCAAAGAEMEGSPGSGKSFALCLAALNYVSRPPGPQRAAVIVVPGPIKVSGAANAMRAILKVFPTIPAAWDLQEEELLFDFSTHRARLTFTEGCSANWPDIHRFAGASFGFLGLDDVELLDEKTVAYLKSRLRLDQVIRITRTPPLDNILQAG